MEIICLIKWAVPKEIRPVIFQLIIKVFQSDISITSKTHIAFRKH